MRTRTLIALAAAVGLLPGCGAGKSQPAFSDLHPVKGVVKRGGQPASGGVVQFYPDPDQPGFNVNSVVGSDGTFALTTFRTTDSNGERKKGAPAGAYKVTYTPALGDQAAGGDQTPVGPKGLVTVNPGDNDLTIDLPAARKK